MKVRKKKLANKARRAQVVINENEYPKVTPVLGGKPPVSLTAEQLAEREKAIYADDREADEPNIHWQRGKVTGNTGRVR